jgi:hypothetical protein
MYTTIGTAISLALLLGYFILSARNRRLAMNEIEMYGRPHTDLHFSEQVLRDKIRHKNIAFYAYLTSLVISFLLGTWAIYKIINNELDWKLLKDAIGISAGTISTISFKNLYKKCSGEVEALFRVRPK